MARPRVLLVVMAALGCVRAEPPVAPPPRPATFMEDRAQHPTRLFVSAPSPGRWRDAPDPDGVTRVEIDSDGRTLWAWLARPDRDPPWPALVYFHGAFALKPAHVRDVEPIVAAGFAVLLPTLRGENGNAGRLELLWGELDDAVAATRWLAVQPEIDRDRIYAVGHSVGGALAALVSLRPDAPVRITGSVGGVYVPQTFARWRRNPSNAGLVRFDPDDEHETRLRTLGPNVDRMVHPHHAFVGEGDAWFHPNVDAIAEAAARVRAPFFAARVPGDHETSLAPGLAAFLAVIARDAEAPR